MKIKPNLGTADRLIRTIISLIMLYFGLLSPEILNDTLATSMLGIMGGISLLVVIIGNCPLYSLINLDTTQAKNSVQDY